MMSHLFPRNENKWKRLIVRIPLVVDVAICALLQSAQIQPMTTSLHSFTKRRQARTSLNQQQFVHWKRPHVRIPLVVDMVVCALLQSEQTRPYTALLVAVYQAIKVIQFK
ncbi:hypothetical protein T12_8310 [Trichinella patagoniensis]|uniref:Uncharacterized protein n=1 Tax=Trichinella patagoniensis TaxID=990121 RepID=A0A0V0ZSP0_9BILA|nr:hypothetical protein T12_8310 [Trichinella patagoniensis]